MKAFLTNTIQVGAITLLSRVFGFARDLLIAKVLGAGRVSDAFFVAFKIPNLFRNIFAEGAFNSVFVPGFSAEFRKSPEAARSYAKSIFAYLFHFLLIFTILTQIFMPAVVGFFAPGFAGDAEKLALSIQLSKIIFPFLMLIALTSFYGSILNSIGLFAPYAATPIVLNICIITAAILGANNELLAAKYMSWAISVSGVMTLYMLWSIANKKGFGVFSLIPRRGREIATFFKNIGPGIISSGIYHVQVLIGTIFAAATNGAISWLYYADRLVQLPLGVIGIAIATVMLPAISAEEPGKASRLFNYSLIFASLLILPCSVALFILAAPIIAMFFEQGAFTALDTIATANALKILAVGLPAIVAVKLFANVFYARQDTATPMICAGIALVVHVGSTIVLCTEFGYLGVVAAIALANWVNFFLLLGICLYRRLMHITLGTAAKTAMLAAVSFALGAGLKLYMPPFTGYFLNDIFYMMGIGAAWLIAYAPFAWLVVRRWRKSPSNEEILPAAPAPKTRTRSRGR
ncbi:MAG: murein biosynthesis integral membrane protein MurJ [Alphaproteobacteria bacterium]|nr:murein biosynthesis integral membrane protein MurJ [Alphaproteobacteria bacterium]